MHAEEKILVFRFKKGQEVGATMREVVPGYIYALERPCLHFEDIIFDLREEIKVSLMTPC